MNSDDEKDYQAARDRALRARARKADMEDMQAGLSLGPQETGSGTLAQRINDNLRQYVPGRTLSLKTLHESLEYHKEHVPSFFRQLEVALPAEDIACSVDRYHLEELPKSLSNLSTVTNLRQLIDFWEAHKDAIAQATSGKRPSWYREDSITITLTREQKLAMERYAETLARSPDGPSTGGGAAR